METQLYLTHLCLRGLPSGTNAGAHRRGEVPKKSVGEWAPMRYEDSPGKAAMEAQARQRDGKGVSTFGGTPGMGSVSKDSIYNAGDCLQCRRLGFDPWVGKIP